MGINLKPHKTIRIAVSHDVFLNKLETLIIDTPEFQRLRRLRQLGSSDLIFPTALHSRFVHSLGTLHMANKIVRCIRENRHNDEEICKIKKEQEQLIRLVALLHDIGHLPFGHTIEDEFNIFQRHDEDIDRTDRLIGRDSRIGEILIKSEFAIGEDLYNQLFKLLTTTKETFHELGDNLFIYDIVNNTVCADLLDYLQRDSYFCDLPVGLDYRFLNYLYLYDDTLEVKVPKEKKGKLQKPNDLFPEHQDTYESKAEDSLFTIDKKAEDSETKKIQVRRTAIRLTNRKGNKPRPDLLNELVALLEYRYKLGEIVYFHHTKLASGSMIAGAVHRAKQDGKIKLPELYEMGDEKLIYTLQERYKEVSDGKNPVKKLVDAFEQRTLWKASSFYRTRAQIDKEQNDYTDVDFLEMIESKFYADPDYRLKKERDVCEKYNMDDGDVLIHCPKNNMQSKLAQMNVFWEGKHRPLADCKHNKLVAEKLALIEESHRNLWSFRIFVNSEVMKHDASIKTYFNDELCLNANKKQGKEKAALTDWIEFEIYDKHDPDKISATQLKTIKVDMWEKVLTEGYKSEKNATNLRKSLNEICKKHGVIKK